MSEEFQDRKLGELPEDSRPDAQVKRRRGGSSSVNPPGSSPGRSQGAPAGNWVVKQGYYPQGRAGAPTGMVPPPLIDGQTGAQKFTEDHPMPMMLTRDALDYFINMVRQVQFTVQQTTWIEPPFFAQCLDLYSPQGGIALGAAAPFTSVVQGPFTVPAGNVGVITSMGQQLDDPEGFDSVIWRIMKNGRPVDCYKNIGIQLGNIAFASKLSVPIQLQPGDTVDFQASNPGGDPFVAFGRIHGWYFPTEVVDNTSRSRLVT